MSIAGATIDRGQSLWHHTRGGTPACMSLLKKSLLAVVIMACAIMPATMSAGRGSIPANEAAQATRGGLHGAITVELASRSIRKSSGRAMKLTPRLRQTFRLATAGQLLPVRS